MSYKESSLLLTDLPTPSVRPSIPDKPSHSTFTLDQELELFGTWTSDPIWVPPKDASRELAKSMLEHCGFLDSKATCWQTLIAENQDLFTQVRQIELAKASIRLPHAKIYVSVTDQKDFSKITDPIPNCVKTRLQEFLDGPGKAKGVRVSYIKPLCVEVNHELLFTTTEELDGIIRRIQSEVYHQYRRLYLSHRPMRASLEFTDRLFAIPRKAIKNILERKKKSVDAYHAKLEFNRRKAALRASKLYARYRTNECTFQEVLSITKTPDRMDVIEQYAAEKELSAAQKERLMVAAAVTLPWFLTLPLAAYCIAKISMITLVPPVLVCDPAFVAEMPNSRGRLLKIGHFDEVNGVMHIEI
jgi:hypothetical protein